MVKSILGWITILLQIWNLLRWICHNFLSQFFLFRLSKDQMHQIKLKFKTWLIFSFFVIVVHHRTLVHTGTPLFSKNMITIHQSNVVSLYWIQFLSKETEIVKLWKSLQSARCCLAQHKKNTFYLTKIVTWVCTRNLH